MESKNAELHEEIAELLPWYQNETLDARERARVERHVAGCGVCAQDLARCRALSTSLLARPAPNLGTSAASLERALQRIAVPASPASRAPLRSRTWTRTPPSVRWLVALQALVVAGLIAALLAPSAQTPRSYVTLGTPARASDARARLQVVFAPGVSELELREIVGSVQGSLVAGPSAHGVYELALPDAAQLDASLRRLRADPRVRLSEPLRAGSAPR